VKKAPVLILDDSSSALDMVTDRNLRKALSKLPYHPTVFIVSQRISSVIDCDRIVVLDDGRVAGIGTSDELLAACDTYREIYNTQTRGGSAMSAEKRRKVPSKRLLAMYPNINY